GAAPWPASCLVPTRRSSFSSGRVTATIACKTGGGARVPGPVPPLPSRGRPCHQLSLVRVRLGPGHCADALDVAVDQARDRRPPVRVLRPAFVVDPDLDGDVRLVAHVASPLSWPGGPASAPAASRPGRSRSSR